MKVFVVTISDRASRGEYRDQSGPAISRWLEAAIKTPFVLLPKVIPDGIQPVQNCLVEACARGHANLVFTTGGTGPAPRDLTPEATRAVIEKELPGFGELMRRASLRDVPTAILSRQLAGIRGTTLIVNLPGKPSAIKTCLDAIFPAIPYCLDLIGAGRIETREEVVSCFRPGA